MLKKLVNQVNQAVGVNNSNTAAPQPATTTRRATATAARKAPASAPRGKKVAAAPAPAAKKAPAAKQPAAAVHTNPVHNSLKDGSTFDGIFDPDTMLPVEGKATFSNGDTMEGKWDSLGTFYEGTFNVLGTPPIVATGSFWYPSGATRPRLKSGRLTKGDLVWEGEFDSTTTKGFLRTGTRTTKAAIESGVFQELPNGQGITLVHGKQQMLRSGVIFEGTFDHRTGKRIEGKETLKSGMVSEGQWQWNGSNEICLQGMTTWLIPKAGTDEKQTASFKGTKNLAGNWVAGEYRMPTGDTTTGSYAVVPTGTTQKKFRLEKGLNIPAAKTSTTREGFFVSKGGITQLVHGRSIASVTAAALKDKCNKARTPGAIEDKTQFRLIQEGDFTDAAFIGTQRLILIEHFEVEVQSSMPVEAEEEISPIRQNQEEGIEQQSAEAASGQEESVEHLQNEEGKDEAATSPAAVAEAKVTDERDDEQKVSSNDDEEKKSQPKKQEEVAESPAETKKTSSHVDPYSSSAEEGTKEETAPEQMRLTDEVPAEEKTEEQNSKIISSLSPQIEAQPVPPSAPKVEVVTRTKLVEFDDSKEESVMGLQVFSTACPAFLWFADSVTTTPAPGSGTSTTTITKTSTELLEYNLVQIEKAYLCGANFFNLMDDPDAAQTTTTSTNSTTTTAGSAVPPSSTAETQEIINFSTMETNRGRKIRREAVSVTKAKSFGRQKDPHNYHTRFALPQYLWTFVDDFTAEEGEPLPIEASLALEDAFYKGDVDLVEFDEDLDNARVSLWEEPRRYWRVPGEEPRPIRREVMTVSMALETETYLKAFLLLNAPLLKSAIDEAEATDSSGATTDTTAAGESQKLPADPEMVDGFMLQYSKASVAAAGTTPTSPPSNDSLSNIGRQGTLTTAHGFDFFDRLPVSLKMRLRPQLAMSRNIDIELTKDWTIPSIKSRLLHIAHLKYCTAVFQDEDYADDVKELLRPLTAQWGGMQLNKEQRTAVHAAQEAEEEDYSHLNLPPFLFEVERVPDNSVRARFIGDDNAVDACLYLAMRWVASESQFKQPSNWQVLDPNNDRDETIRQEKNANYLFNVNLSTPEHSEVQKFFNFKFKKEITQIQRIQNTVLYEKYVQKRRQIAKEHHGDANEVRWLWHGTRGTEPMLMCSDGFDMRFCDKGFYGRASYFAYDAHYSHNFRHNNGDGTASMFLALVTCGLIEERTQKDENIRRPEPPCHSIKGPVTQSGMEAIMIYELNQAYPAYLVTYKI